MSLVLRPPDQRKGTCSFLNPLCQDNVDNCIFYPIIFMSVVPSCLCLPSSIIKRKSGGFLRNFCTPINTTIANVQISEAETILAPQTEEQ